MQKRKKKKNRWPRDTLVEVIKRTFKNNLIEIKTSFDSKHFAVHLIGLDHKWWEGKIEYLRESLIHDVPLP